VARGQVASDHGWLVELSRPVRSGGDKLSRRSEVGNTKRRSLNTRLSSGTSAGTFAVSAGPYRNYHANADTKNEPWHVFGTISKKGLENRSSRFEPKNSWLSFSRGSGPSLKIKSARTNEQRQYLLCVLFQIVQPIPLEVTFSKAQSSKLERLFYHVSVRRHVRTLSVELWNSFRKCHPKWDRLYLSKLFPIWICTADPTWGDIFECCFKAQSSKLKRLFCHVSVKRDVWALSFELWNSFRNCHPKWDWLYPCHHFFLCVNSLDHIPRIPNK